MFVSVLAKKETGSYLLELLDNSSNKSYRFDCTQYLELGDFIVLKDVDVFKTVELDALGGVNWLNGKLSLSQDTLIAQGKLLF